MYFSSYLFLACKCKYFFIHVRKKILVLTCLRICITIICNAIVVRQNEEERCVMLDILAKFLVQLITFMSVLPLQHTGLVHCIHRYTTILQNMLIKDEEVDKFVALVTECPDLACFSTRAYIQRRHIHMYVIYKVLFLYMFAKFVGILCRDNLPWSAQMCSLFLNFFCFKTMLIG